MRNLKWKAWVIGPGLLVLFGCTAPKQDRHSDHQCRWWGAPQWQAAGLRDGAHGEDSTAALEGYAMACRAEPDQAPYMVGWRQGIEQYCTPEAAYRMGSSGSAFKYHFCAGQVPDLALLETQWQLGIQGHRARFPVPPTRTRDTAEMVLAQKLKEEEKAKKEKEESEKKEKEAREKKLEREKVTYCKVDPELLQKPGWTKLPGCAPK